MFFKTQCLDLELSKSVRLSLPVSETPIATRNSIPKIIIKIIMEETY
jgi:hypothetical protein